MGYNARYRNGNKSVKNLKINAERLKKKKKLSSELLQLVQSVRFQLCFLNISFSSLNTITLAVIFNFNSRVSPRPDLLP